MVQKNAAVLDQLFHALADPTRRAMLYRLAEGEHKIGDLAAPFAMSFAAASKHVRVLEKAGLVRRRIQGRAHYCRLEPAPLTAAQEWLRFYEAYWGDRLEALDLALTTEDGQKGGGQNEHER